MNEYCIIACGAPSRPRLSEINSMKSKVLVCGALVAALTMSVAFSGCGNATRNEEDMNQVIATVDISKKTEMVENAGLTPYVSAISSQKNIIKRDLIAAYYNSGSSISDSSSAASVFNSLVDALTGTAVISQYATLELIRQKTAENSSFFTEYMAKPTEIERYEYLLNGETAEHEERVSDRVLLARYALYSSINSALDSLEQAIIDEEEGNSTSTETRTTPGGAGEEVEDYLPLNDDGTLNYGLYTGYEGTDAEGNAYHYTWDYVGAYQDDAVEGTTKQTRRKAYAQFVANLRDNFLILDGENAADIMGLSYIQDEYLSQLQQQVINEYNERYAAEQEALVESVVDGEYTFLKAQYAAQFEDDKASNDDPTAFESTMSSLSDSSFILYAPATDGTEGGTFGYVYNILLPFSAEQNLYIDNTDTSAEYYFSRKDILAGIQATDQRSAWFNGATDYSFDASGWTQGYFGKSEGRNYLFFEDNLKNSARYAELDKYAGLYSYNGTVAKNADDSYALSPVKMDVDGFLTEMEEYVEYIMGGDTVTISHNDAYDVTSPEQYYTAETADEPDEADRKIDYSRFVYATGKVEIGDTSLSSLFIRDGAAYKALTAVNELQYAYTTDTGVLSNYIGYSVSAYETDYVPEFEYAAQAAVDEGAGTIYVCGADYGWHVIYVTATFSREGGAVYGDDISWTVEDVTTEGTFQNMYYTWMKDSILTNVDTNNRLVINQNFGGETSIELFEDAYSDLLGL